MAPAKIPPDRGEEPARDVRQGGGSRRRCATSSPPRASAPIEHAEQFAARIKADTAKFVPLIKASGISGANRRFAPLIKASGAAK